MAADKPQEDGVSVPSHAASPMSSINAHHPPGADDGNVKTEDSKDGITDVKEEKNVVKSNANKKHDAVHNGPATEKERMMDQMNANQSGLADGSTNRERESACLS